MKHFRIIFISIALLALGQVAMSQSAISYLNQGAEQYNNFVNLYNNGNKAAAFPTLYNSYESYMMVINDASALSARPQAAKALLDVLPYLEQAAYYYSNMNDQAKTSRYAQAYVTVATTADVQRLGPTLSNNYVMLTKVASSSAWNNHDYAKAIPFLHAYLSTGDTSMRLVAYNNLGLAYSKVNNFSRAKMVLEDGLVYFPGNYNLLMTLVDACIKNNDTEGMQKYLPKAIVSLPSSDRRLPTLLNTLGMLQEKQLQYEQAIATFERLRQLMPNDLNTAKHLAQDYYNAGALHQQLATEASKKSEQKQHRQQAEQYFQKAEPVLRSVMASDPLSVKYALALANVYSSLGDQAQLQTINQKLQALGYEGVSSNKQGAMSLMAMDEKVPADAVRRQAPAQNSYSSYSQPMVAQTTSSQSVSSQPNIPTVPVPVSHHAVSDVDVNIPVNKANNENTFAVIIANENYNRVASVPMAENDGRMFAEYCQKVLGLPKSNIRDYYDATALVMNDALQDIKNIAKTYPDGGLNVIFYYSGHGVPDEETKDAFLLPVDANGQSSFGCIPLNKLYSDLTDLNARSVLVFMDCCFSGSVRGEGMLASARGVALKAKPAQPKGNMVVFSAATGTQTAMPYPEQRHGLFTYYLLKKLQETKGKVTLGELGDYLTSKVSQKAQVVNRKPQTPTIEPSLALRDKWKNIKLINK